jgi:hypothetical protein
MRFANELLQDETGLVLSAEAVMIGTLGVVGAVVGLNAASSAVDQELKEFAGAIRSLDQSYGYMGHQSCRAWSAGSYYRQPDVQQSLSDLCNEGTPDIGAIQKHVDSQRKLGLPLSEPVPATPVVPNKITVSPPQGQPGAASKPEANESKNENRKPNRKNESANHKKSPE